MIVWKIYLGCNPRVQVKLHYGIYAAAVAISFSVLKIYFFKSL